MSPVDIVNIEPPAHEGVVAQAIRNPVTVAVGVLLVALFGLQALFSVPIQLTPDISRPVITVQTVWPGANPQEVEREIVERQEEVLKSIEGLLGMESSAAPNSGTVMLEFAPGTDIDAALLRVNNKLNQVPGYPAEAQRPIMSAAGAREEAIGWFILVPAEGAGEIDVERQLEFVEDEVKSRFERVPGVAAANIFGGREEQIEVTVDPEAVAQRGLTLRQVADRLAAEDKDTSAGHFDEGKRRYMLRAIGAFADPKEIESIVLRDDERDRVVLRDVGTARVSYKEPTMVVRYKGIPALALSAQKRAGTNVLEVMAGVKVAIQELNDGVLAPRGLKLVTAYDSTLYIEDALSLVQENILVGALLAVVVLLLFLRAAAPTAIVALAIPISAVGTFLAMFLLGRNVNIVSLAGLAFAVGMLVDNSIVVIESIYSRIEAGEEPLAAAIHGTTDVWGAVLASTLTTVAVFLPIFFLEAEVAQLFRDIAIAIACAVAFSLAVSVLVIPTLAARWMRAGEGGAGLAGGGEPSGAAAALGRFVHWVCGSLARRLGLVVLMTAVSVGGSWMLSPPAEYLPGGNQNLLFGILLPPSGYNLAEFERIGEQIEGEMSPLWTGPDAKIGSFFYIAYGRQVMMGVIAAEGAEISDLKGPVYQAISQVPGMIAIVVQPGLFDQGLSGGRNIDLRLQGPDLETLIGIGQQAFGLVGAALPGSQTQPIPGLELGQPEIRLIPDRDRLAEAGLSASDLGFAFDVLADGARISEIRTGDGRKIDLVLRGNQEDLRYNQQLGEIPIYVPSEGLLPLEALGRIELEMGPDTIQHNERERSIVLRITPPASVPLEAAMGIVREQVVGPLEASGRLKGAYKWRMAGTADKLTATKDALLGQFLMAILVTYLLMASLFESFLFPLVILFSVPLASLGGFAGLRLVNLAVAPQSLDVLAMLGFVILVGIVVNNAILLVDRSLKSIREGGMDDREAVSEAVTARFRPIFMSTLTSVFGMAPLVFMAGAGSELYRGIGSVVVGGLLVSTVFTLVLVPSLLSLVLSATRRFFPGSSI